MTFTYTIPSSPYYYNDDGHPDGQFSVTLDGVSVVSGTLLTETFTYPFNFGYFLGATLASGEEVVGSGFFTIPPGVSPGALSLTLIVNSTMSSELNATYTPLLNTTAVTSVLAVCDYTSTATGTISDSATVTPTYTQTGAFDFRPMGSLSVRSPPVFVQ